MTPSEALPVKKLKDSKPRIVLHDGRELQYHNPRSPYEAIDLQSLVPIWAQGYPLEIEIGPGKGEFLARRAPRYPERFFIGIDRRSDRAKLTEKKLGRLEGGRNWCVIKEDARAFLNTLPQIQMLHVYQPDPWPKAKHHKHRFFRSPDARRWAEAIVTGGELRLSTDHRLYFEEILDIVLTWKLFKVDFAFVKSAKLGTAMTHFEGIFLRRNEPVYKAHFVKL